MEKGECPFCGKKSVLVEYKPPTLQIKGSRGSGQSRKMTFRSQAETIVMSGCAECGKTHTQVKDKIEGKGTGVIGKCVWCKEPCPDGKIECEDCYGIK